MERRYYLLKVCVMLLAVVTAVATSGVASVRAAHAVNDARYSASSQIEAAAWRGTSYVAHALASLFDACAARPI